MAGEANLLGRLAIHYKLLTAEQLAETTLAQSRDIVLVDCEHERELAAPDEC